MSLKNDKSFPSPCVENCLPDGENSTIIWQSGNCTCIEEEYKEQAKAQKRLLKKKRNFLP